MPDNRVYLDNLAAWTRPLPVTAARDNCCVPPDARLRRVQENELEAMRCRQNCVFVDQSATTFVLLFPLYGHQKGIVFNAACCAVDDGIGSVPWDMLVGPRAGTDEKEQEG